MAQSQHRSPASAAHPRSLPLAARRGVAIVLGALVVALAAQVSVPLPGSPVPMTLSPLAVLVVGGVLGPGPGATALAVYLGLGALGVPVFVGGGGAWRLVGPTGGYLLAFPVAAALVGWLASRRLVRCFLAAALGMAVIHLAGIAHLALLGGDVMQAIHWGSVPFLAGDVLKITIAAVVIAGLLPRTRPQLDPE